MRRIDGASGSGNTIFDLMEKVGSNINGDLCQNCDSPLQSEAKYCHVCGQGVKESRLSIVQVVKEALVNFFNLDGRFFHTVRDLYSPSKLTRTYVAGKRKFYMNPARLFLVSLILFISVVMSDIDLSDFELFGDSGSSKIELAKQKRKWDALVAREQFANHQDVLSALADSLYGTINLDSLYLKDNVKIAGIGISDYNIRLADAYSLSGDELVEKYEITGFWDCLYVKQYHKILVDPQGGIRYVIKNATWVVLILIFVMAMFMKLYYIRSGKYYVEHLVLMMYGHSLLFLSTSGVLLFSLLFNIENNAVDIMGLLYFLLLVIQYLSLKKYYGQGWFKTLFKQFLINCTYFIAAILILSIGTLISIAIF